MMMKKVGFLAFLGTNYGTVLQSFALYQSIKRIGYDCYVIGCNEFRNRKTPDENLKETNPKEYDKLLMQKTFETFINKWFYFNEVLGSIPANASLSEEQKEELKNFDAFVCGSDQIWKPGGFWFCAKRYLQFAPEAKRIGYAPSVGWNKIPASAQQNVPQWGEWLSSVRYLSTRETTGSELVAKVTGRPVTTVLDPTFLLRPEDWNSFLTEPKFSAEAESILKSNKKYILAYLLDTYEKYRPALIELANKFDMNIIWLTGRDNVGPVQQNCAETDPAGFVHLIKNASLVCADGFHGTCFSLNFSKPFIVLSKGDAKGNDSRMQNILHRLGVNGRIISSAEELSSFKNVFDMNYEDIKQNIDRERNNSLTYLTNALLGASEYRGNLYESLEKFFPEEYKERHFFKTVEYKLSSITDCTGCGACSVICPQNAIKMHKDVEGFFRPHIDKHLCTNCGLCAKNCIIINPKYKNDNTPKCYAVMANDIIREKSSSGGMFTLAAQHIFNLGGYVCGAAFKNNFEVEHIIIDSNEDLYKLRGSKYMQSNASSTYSDIKKLLELGKHVLFTGMPCQVAGLYAYLNKDYKTLYTMDLVCHGITSSKVFDKYHQEVLSGKKITRLEFKAKEPWGWHAGINAYFEDGTKYSVPLESDPYFKAYLQSISKNIACANCTSNRMPRQGDLTIGDFWRVGVFDASLNDNKGTSLVLVNNDKGQEFFNKLQKNMVVVREAPLDIAISGNKSLQHSYPMHKNRNLFFKNFDSLQFSSLQNGCSNNRVYEQHFMELSKKVSPRDHELYFLAKFVSDHYRGRKIITWVRSARFEQILYKHFGLSVAFGVSQRKNALIKGKIESFDMLKGKSSDYYLVSLDKSYDNSIYAQLFSYGYSEHKDFIFRKFKPIVLENIDLSKGNYYDDFGNSIEGFQSIVGKIIFRGFNNHIMLGKNMISARFLTFDLCANSCTDIGEGVKFNSPAQIESKGFAYGSFLKIGSGCSFNNGALFRFYTPSSAIIGDYCTASSKFGLHVNMGKKAIIGRDCMFSFENELWAGDGHAIFDVKSGECTNRKMSGSYHPSNLLVLGEHVWVGKQAFLMHGTNIGSGSIVGARSVVKGTFPNNCTIAGNPAIKVKEDVAWSRDGMASGLESCGRPEYAALTRPARAPISGRKVLVIGGTRFMGVQLVKELIALGNDVTIATRGRKRDGFGMYVERLFMDVSNEASVKAALSGKYFDVVFDNLAYCSLYANNVLSHVKCGKYIQLSSMETYENMMPDMREEYFNPYNLQVEIRGVSVGYVKGKRLAEAVAYQYFKNLPVTTVRIPYVTKTDRLFYYCKSIVKQEAMNIDDVSRGFTFIRDTEVGSFLPWIAAQDFRGPINLASEGMVTIDMILKYIEEKTGKTAIIDPKNGTKSPFHEFNEKTFSLNMDKAKQLGYQVSNINNWFWTMMDEYINRAVK